MPLKVVELTSLNIDQVYPDSEWTFPRPRPADVHDRRRAWIMEVLSKGFRHFSAFNETGEKVALVEYMPIEESLDNIVGVNVNSIHCYGTKQTRRTVSQHKHSSIGLRANLLRVDEALL